MNIDDNDTPKTVSIPEDIHAPRIVDKPQRKKNSG